MPSRLLVRAVSALSLLLAGCQPPAVSTAVQGELAVEPGAAQWRPMVVTDVTALRPAAPPDAAAELAEVKAWQARRTADDEKAIAYWNDQAAPLRWSELSRDLVIKHGLVPPRAARALAMTHIAMYDAAIATWDAKRAHRRAAPGQIEPGLKVLAGEAGVPSYPSEHAAIAYAAAAALAEVFPAEKDDLFAKARAAAETRVAAGANFRSDVTAGQAIGEAVATAVIARARQDGSDQKAQLPLVTQPGQWTHAAPMEPLAGHWKTWLVSSSDQFALQAPFGPGTPAHQASMAEVVAVGKALTAEQRATALKWNLDAPAVQWNDIARPIVAAKQQSTPAAARTLAYLHALMADTFITCWNTKYKVLLPRPTMADTSFQSFVTTPPHPSYPSGHASCSAAAATYLSAVFPDEAAGLNQNAEEAAMSRLYGGIHYRRDNDDGLGLGRAMGRFVAERAQLDGRP
ncbi:MAG: phosphatase PAP2 family protein [Candidatus Sericytochromatia bacterium]